MEVLDLGVSQVAADDMGDSPPSVIDLKGTAVLSHQQLELLTLIVRLFNIVIDHAWQTALSFSTVRQLDRTRSYQPRERG